MKQELPNPPFVDERGSITNLTTTGTQSVAVITSKAGSVRAKHWHTDEHSAYVVSGRVEYWERLAGVDKAVVFGPGDMFVSRAGIEHAMRFLEDSVIVTLATGIRSHENHEAAVHRVEWELPPLPDARYDVSASPIPYERIKASRSYEMMCEALWKKKHAADCCKLEGLDASEVEMLAEKAVT